MPPSAITVPHERSTPAVRMTSVWPIAITPTTITCCSTSDRLSPVRKRSLRAGEEGACGEQREQRAERPGSGTAASVHVRSLLSPKHSFMPVATSLLSTPLTGLAAMSETPVSV